MLGRIEVVQPWRALNRGFFLLITYVRPRRRITRQSLSRFFSERRELRIFISCLREPRRVGAVESRGS